MGTMALSGTTTWESLFTTIGNQLGVTIEVDDIHPNYLHPDPEELTRRYENIAVMLDAISSSVGQHIVTRYDGSIRSQSWSAARTQIAANTVSGTISAGGDSVTGSQFKTPERVTVTFPKWRDCLTAPNDLYALTNAASPATAPNGYTRGAAKVIHSTCFADFSTRSVFIGNAGNVLPLASRITTDYLSWQLYDYHYRFNSVKNWIPNGYDDYVEFCYGAHQGGDYRAYTKVVSRPANLEVEEQLSQVVSKPNCHESIAAMVPCGEEIEAIDESGKPGVNNDCCLFRLLPVNPANLALGYHLSSVLDSDGKQLRAKVFNIHDSPIESNQPPDEFYFLVHPDDDGNWLAEQSTSGSSGGTTPAPTTSTTSTSSTTPQPGTTCVGSCKWI